MRPWHNPRIVLKELALGVVVLLSYLGVSALSQGRGDLAIFHARQLIALERSLGIFVEPALQRAVGVGLWAWILSEFYLLAHPLITLGFIVGLFVSGRDEYPDVRNLLVTFSLLSFAIYLLYPAAPPRMVPESGMNDLVEGSGTVDYERGVMKYLMRLVDPYAAMPSVHFGYSLIVGGFFLLALRRKPLRILGPAYPAVMLVSVAATGNHFLVDCLASVLVVLTSKVVADRASSFAAFDARGGL